MLSLGDDGVRWNGGEGWARDQGQRQPWCCGDGSTSDGAFRGHGRSPPARGTAGMEWLSARPAAFSVRPTSVRQLTQRDAGRESPRLEREPEVGQEARPARRAILAHRAAHQDQPVLRTRHRYVEQTAGLAGLVLEVVLDRSPSGEAVVLDAEDVHARELEPLGGVEREQVDVIWVGARAVRP